MPDYFLDTSVLVAYFRGEDPRSRTLIEEVLSGGATAAVSAITVAEIWSAKAMDETETQRYRQAVIQLMETVPVDVSVAKRGGAIRRTHGLKVPDALIAACCQTVGGHFYSKDPHFEQMLSAREMTGEVYS